MQKRTSVHINPAALALILFALAWSTLIPATVAHAQVTDDQVQAGIDRLVQQIYDAQNDRGTWDPPERGSDHTYGANWGGTTALMTFALITAGESHQDPRLKPAIEFLKQADIIGTYAVAFRAHLWAALPDEFGQYLRRDVQWLVGALGPYGYDYTDTPRDGRVDNSVTQYGVLGVWEGAKRGIPVPNRYWSAVQEHFVEYQLVNGAWSYTSDNVSRGSMAAAGIAALYVTQDYLHRNDFRELAQTPEHPVQKRIDRGLDWFGENFRPDSNPGVGSYTQYYLYGVERIGLASGVRYFAGHDWYGAGAEWVLANQHDGVNAPFALMFLVRGRVPAFINKLQLPDFHWNNRPRDVANLTAWVSDETERKMMWQVLPIDSDVEEWLEAPMLYLSGHEELSLSEEQEAKLKRYMDLGGMIIFSADDGSSEFTDSVRGLLGRLYPYQQLEAIPEGDPLVSLVYDVRLGSRLEPATIHNGVRHLAMILPHNVSWDLHRSDHSDPRVWQLLTNAYFYATERGRTRDRLDTHFLARSRSGGGPEVKVGRAVYEGNHDPEPLAWEIQSNFIFNNSHATVDLTAVQLSDLPEPSEVPFVHVAGTEDQTFSQAELDSIGSYVEAGGLMLFENVGGQGDFATAASTALRELFARRLRPISRQSALITGEGIEGHDVSTVAYRPYTLLRMGKIDAPRLQAISFDDQVRIIVSQEDLSMAMLDQPVWRVFGYDADSAHKIVTNMVLEAARR
ncbi:MAG: DUF4159 domain-containing protein [Phycisphaeraceae bacterium]